MSYDLMVFNKESAPKTSIDDFLEWYEEQTQWKEDHNYDDPAVSSENLKNWFMEMIQTFPAMNGPYAPKIEDENFAIDESFIADYSVGKEMIYASFAWSKANEAYEKAIELVEKFNLGFYDISGEDGDISIFDEKGKLELI